MKKPIIPIIILTTLFATALIANATLPPLSPPPVGGYDSGSNSILDPGCAPGTPNCWVNLPSGGSGWSLTGNSGTTAGTNFIGTTDAQDFMVKTNGNQIALFGQQGNVAIGSDNTGIDPILTLPTASNVGSVAFQSGQATGVYSTAFGVGSLARSYIETSFGANSTDYGPLDVNNLNSFDRLFSVGNGTSVNHNAYTLWKDGSFAYNDDNFQNDNPGTEQNMFYFNYGNHDGNGNAQTKRAIRLGSVSDNTWDIANVGDRSVAIGFSATPLAPTLTGPVASGVLSFATQLGNASGEAATAMGWSVATGALSMSWGGDHKGGVSPSIPHASGDYSTAWGGGLNIASGIGATVFGISTTASGMFSTAFGESNFARSENETAFGQYGTDYTTIGRPDRLLNIGNGTNSGSESDALTILKNGQTGIAIDNFETNSNGNIFQVGDGTTGIIGYVDNGTGNWMAVSDERKKHNITDIQYGLNEILQLKPVSFDYNRNNEHTIGFLAQQVLPIIPEAVSGDEEKGYAMSYSTLTPALVKAIQELNLKIDLLSLNTGNTSTNIFDSLKSWFADVGNGIETIIAKVFKADRVETKELCVGQTCLNEQQIQQIIQSVGMSATSPSVIQNNTNLTTDSDSNNSTNNDTTVSSVDETPSDQVVTNDVTSNPDPGITSDTGSITE